MKNILILAGIAAFAASAPAFADPGKGKGNSQGKSQGHGNSSNAKPHGGGYGTGGCPPGLAKKGTGCLPPGQAKKLYNVGQHWPARYGHAWTYNQIPVELRTRYHFESRYNYYYGDGYLYRVDPTTMAIAQVVSAILN
jgi:opacity protein-like surface antigen